MQLLHRSIPDLAWTQNAARPRDDIGDIALMQRVRTGWDDRLVRTSKPQAIAVEHEARGTSMDTTSIVTSHPALADSEARLQGAGTCRASPAGERAMKGPLSWASGNIGSQLRGQLPRLGIDPRSAKPSKQPNPLDFVAQSYEGGAVVALDFTAEEARPKAGNSTCPTTT